MLQGTKPAKRGMGRLWDINLCNRVSKFMLAVTEIPRFARNDMENNSTLCLSRCYLNKYSHAFSYTYFPVEYFGK